MTLVRIAQDLLVQTYEIPDPNEPGFYIGTECSQPVPMPSRALVKLSVVLQRAVGADFEVLVLVQGSNDLSTWHTVDGSVLFTGADQLPVTKEVGSTGGIRVPYAHARVLWVLYPLNDPPLLGPGQGLLLSADLNAATGEGP